MKLTMAMLLILPLAGCIFDSDQRDAGYQDGYAVGYNTACEIRATMINGEWGNSTYSEGYASGVTDGIIACNRDR